MISETVIINTEVDDTVQKVKKQNTMIEIQTKQILISCFKESNTYVSFFARY